MTKRGELTEVQIVQLLAACAANGADLLEEARVLYSKRHYARAYVLSQLASEEFAKAHLLLSLLVAQVAGMKPLMESFWDWWINHEDKSSFEGLWNDTLSRPSVLDWLNLPPNVVTNDVSLQWMDALPGSLADAQRDARSTARWREDATYVDFRDGRIYVPKGRVGRGKAQRKIAQVSAEAQRVKEIAAAPLGEIVQRPDAVDFLRTSVQDMTERLARAMWPSEPEPTERPEEP